MWDDEEGDDDDDDDDDDDEDDDEDEGEKPFSDPIAQSEFEREANRIKSNPSYSLMKSIAQEQGADAVLREICRFDTIMLPDGTRSTEYPRGTNSFKTISKFYSRFVLMLMEEEDDVHGDVDNDDEVSLLPYEFMCPITHELLQVSHYTRLTSLTAYPYLPS